MALSQGTRVGGGRRRLPFPEVRRSHRGAAHHVGARVAEGPMDVDVDVDVVYNV